MKLEPQDEISCPDCDRVMVKCLSVPKRGESNWAHHFELVEFKGQPGDKCNCSHCGSCWMTALYHVHIRTKGWIRAKGE